MADDRYIVAHIAGPAEPRFVAGEPLPTVCCLNCDAVIWDGARTDAVCPYPLGTAVGELFIDRYADTRLRWLQLPDPAVNVPVERCHT